MSGPAQQPREIPVLVVVPPRVLLLDIAGPVEVLRKANLEQAAVRFAVAYVGPSPAVDSSIGLALAAIAPLPETLPQEALVVVPGAVDDPLGRVAAGWTDDAAHETAIVRWLARVVRPGIRLATICSGALLAARAGLLDGHACTTHHATIAELVRVAPLASVLDNRLFVESGERLTSAGITAGVDLMLHLVAQEAGHAAALAVARYLVVYLRRAGSDPQLSPWLEGRNHIHPAIHRAQDAIAADPTRDWSVAALARVAAASPRNLSRLFNAHAGMSVTAYVNRMRIALAYSYVTGSQIDIEQVAERAGFASTRQFRRVWNHLYALPPHRMREVQAATIAGPRRNSQDPHT